MGAKRMSNLMLLTALVLLISAPCAEAVNKGNTGCGLGYYFFKDSKDSFATQLLAVTTNSFGTATFGILTETFGCRQPKSLVRDERLNEFVADNMDSLAAEMARGEGEALFTLAELMHVPAEDRPAFYSELKENFPSIFTRSDIRSAELIDNIIRVTG